MTNSNRQSTPSQKTNRYGTESQAVRQEPMSATSSDPYLTDPVFQAALREYRSGKWDSAMILADRLLKKYPRDRHLRIFRQKIQHRIENNPSSYQNHSSYIAARKHLKKKEWFAGLKAVDYLLEIYPEVKLIEDLRKALQKGANRQQSINRLLLIAMLVFFSLALVFVSSLVYRYVRQPGPLAEILIPQASLNLPPHYLFSIHDVDQPVGVALSPNSDRIYVTEMGGTRMVRIFNRDGNPLDSFTSPHTDIGERAPVYVTTDSSGRVYISDRLQHAIFIFTSEGAYIDTLLGPDLSLSEYVNEHTEDQSDEGIVSYNLLENAVFLQTPNETDRTMDLPVSPVWSPLGIRISQADQMYLTDVRKDHNSVFEISLADQSSSPSWSNFDPDISQFGTSGDGNGEFLFPNSAIADSSGRVYVSDGNNRRISVWDSEGKFLYNFGGGTGAAAFSLPRGLFIDWRERLYVVDTVAQNIKVYDVSGSLPEFLFEFGELGLGDGSFNYPNDIAIDSSGRLYIADRENNRVQVWSY